MLTITHTHAAGTLIEGTNRGDGTADVLKACGSRWGRSISAWFVPQSRDRLPKLHIITHTETALEAAGFGVETNIDTAHRPMADVEAGKIERQADRVDALAAKAERKSTAEDAAWTKARAAHDRLPEGGEPIKVGHHSESRHRNAIAQADNAMRKSVEASTDATTAQAHADAATLTTDARYRPVTDSNRIETLGRSFESWNDLSSHRVTTTHAATSTQPKRSSRHARTASRLTLRRSATSSPTGKPCAPPRSRAAQPPATTATPSRRATG